MINLREYQQTCVDKAVEYLRKSTDPGLIDAAPAAGKSYMIAAISDKLYEMSGGMRVLNLAPSKELVMQNREKMLLTGHGASVFSASAGEKSTRHNIVFATPLTVKGALGRFTSGYCAVNIDEAHNITPTIKHIVDRMREENPRLRVFGWSGTPFRLSDGYVYRLNPDGSPVPDTQTRDPYFSQCVHRVPAREMLDQGFLCPMVIGQTMADSYDTSGLTLNSRGKFDDADLHRVFVGKGRKTSLIVSDVVKQAKSRFGGCMLFAATREHAKEIMESLPPGNSGLVTGDESYAVDGRVRGRDSVVKAYRNMRFKYLVSVGALTTGFDVEHTSIIATLRKTESAALLQQILGRAWRLHEEKPDCLWLDYTGQCDEHFPDGDIYNPVIKASGKMSESVTIDATCATCGTVNKFSARKNTDGFEYDEEGYFVDLMGNRIGDPPMPGHYGRRCQGMTLVYGSYVQCPQRWSLKICPHCSAENDISARYCCDCRGEIIDPNDKLIADFRAMKRDPSKVQVDEVLEWKPRRTVSRSGNEVIRTDIVTPYRSFSVWFNPDAKWPKQAQEYRDMMAATHGGSIEPETVTYFKDETKFYKILAYNQPADRCEVS